MQAKPKVFVSPIVTVKLARTAANAQVRLFVDTRQAMYVIAKV